MNRAITFIPPRRDRLGSYVYMENSQPTQAGSRVHKVRSHLGGPAQFHASTI